MNWPVIIWGKLTLNILSQFKWIVLERTWPAWPAWFNSVAQVTSTLADLPKEIRRWILWRATRIWKQLKSVWVCVNTCGGKYMKISQTDETCNFYCPNCHLDFRSWSMTTGFRVAFPARRRLEAVGHGAPTNTARQPGRAFSMGSIRVISGELTNGLYPVMTSYDLKTTESWLALWEFKEIGWDAFMAYKGISMGMSWYDRTFSTTMFWDNLLVATCGNHATMGFH